jgi:hypothetical protein
MSSRCESYLRQLYVLVIAHSSKRNLLNQQYTDQLAQYLVGIVYMVHVQSDFIKCRGNWRHSTAGTGTPYTFYTQYSSGISTGISHRLMLM